mgnify:CR=1 FL=1
MVDSQSERQSILEQDKGTPYVLDVEKRKKQLNTCYSNATREGNLENGTSAVGWNRISVRLL